MLPKYSQIKTNKMVENMINIKYDAIPVKSELIKSRQSILEDRIRNPDLELSKAWSRRRQYM